MSIPGELQSDLAARKDLRVTRLDDQLLVTHGHDVRSGYAEYFWLPVLGPSSLFALRRLNDRLDSRQETPEAPTYMQQIDELSLELGLGVGMGRNSPIIRTLARIVTFGLAEFRGDTYSVRKELAPLTRGRTLRLPDHLQRLHTAFGDRALVSV